ncbi:hypothetical protein DY052_05990 [Apilactobacillus timberlakei]|uniref:hypothetical protein n=1 Tax=Apilactobacillus timberlakei TaxID=2008380 RepID=UPI00112C7351|nr:hypothetical protein [Apilactobacillus timberlakei]TPR14974.1 hypothetical protein DY052_05990 [Apilactobacillus timberlakei]
MNFDNIKKTVRKSKDSLKKKTKPNINKKNSNISVDNYEHNNLNDISEEEKIVSVLRQEYEKMNTPLINTEDVFNDNPLSDKKLEEDIANIVKNTFYEKGKLFRKGNNFVDANERQIIPKYYSPYMYDYVQSIDSFIQIEQMDKENKTENNSVQID